MERLTVALLLGLAAPRAASVDVNESGGSAKGTDVGWAVDVLFLAGRPLTVSWYIIHIYTYILYVIHVCIYIYTYYVIYIYIT